MNDGNLNAFQYVKQLIDDNEIQGLSQIDIDKLRAIYQTVDKETQKKDITKITSRSSAAAIINALQNGYKLETNYDPRKFKSLVKILTDKIKDGGEGQDSLK